MLYESQPQLGGMLCESPCERSFRRGGVYSGPYCPPPIPEHTDPPIPVMLTHPFQKNLWHSGNTDPPHWVTFRQYWPTPVYWIWCKKPSLWCLKNTQSLWLENLYLCIKSDRSLSFLARTTAFAPLFDWREYPGILFVITSCLSCRAKFHCPNYSSWMMNR